MKIPEFYLTDFEIDQEFGKTGGQANIFKGSHKTHGEVTIKRWFTASDDMREEVEFLKKNIIQFLGILLDKTSECIGYVMPYMPMGSLYDVIHDKSQQYDQKQIKSWITQICYGLSYLHGEKIIHRDIKPQNVLLGRCYDDVKLSDFGMAKSVEMISYALTRLGTPFYMAPEVLKRERYDKSADIYSLSITIWEILYRRKNRLNFRCWHADASKRPIIQDVLEFFNNTEFVYTGLHNAVNECATSFEHLNVCNNNESFSKTITDGKVAKLKVTFDSNNAESKNAKNELNFVHTTASINNESLSPISFNKPIEKSPEKQIILLVDGDIENSLLMLEHDEQNWRVLDIKLPYLIKEHGAQFLNNNIYIFGGWNKENKQLNCTYRLSESLKWEKVADMNEKRSGISNSSVILNHQIWVCGGWDGGPLKTVEMYDPETNKWKHMKQMNQCRQLAAAALVNEKIFCSGGSNGREQLNSIEYYDPSSNVWTLICNMPLQIWGHCAVEINGHFIVMGGWSSTNGYLKNAWSLDTTDKNAVWIEKPSMFIPRKNFSIAKIHDNIFICGGITNKDNLTHNTHEEGWDGLEDASSKLSKNLDDVAIFDGEVWRNGPRMPSPRHWVPAVVISMQFAKELEQFADLLMSWEDVDRSSLPLCQS